MQLPGARLSATCFPVSAEPPAWKSLEQDRQLEVNVSMLKDRKTKGVNITDCFTPARGRDPDEEPAAGASKADNSPHYKERQRAAGKGGKKMVQRPKLNSTCKITTAGWDLGGARRDMTDLKARNKGKKPNENTVSL